MKPRILLVDDHKANLDLLEGVLATEDADFVTVTSGEAAIEAAAIGRFAVCLLDVNMPGLNGFETAERIRRVPGAAGMPIIFVTAEYDEASHVFKGYEAGAVDYLVKPVEHAVLRSKVRVFLELFQHRQRAEEQSAELARMVAVLKSQNEALEEFSRVASHDLKAPVRAMRGFRELLVKRLGPVNRAAQRCLDGMQSAGERMEVLIDDLLSFARLDSADSPFEDVALSDAVEQARADLADLVDEAGATIVVGKLPTVRGVPTQLTRLFSNLLENALKYRGEDPPLIRIDVTRIAGGHEIHVEDNGLGVDLAHQKDIFLPFRRLHGQRDYPGSGIGLASCRRIVDIHNGHIRCESLGEGHGTTFVITLPAPSGAVANQ